MDQRTDTKALAVAVVSLIVAVVAALLALVAYDRAGSGREAGVINDSSQTASDSLDERESMQFNADDAIDATTVPQTQP